MKIVSLLSGGIDSSTLLYYLYHRKHILYPFVIDYGQRHKREIEAARMIARSLGLTPKEFVLDSSIFLGSALTDNIPVPEGSYDKETMSVDIVPNRNSVLISLAGAYAVSIKADAVAYAAHSGDHWLYPDCRPSFVSSMRKTIKQGAGLKLITPFINWSKADIVKEGLKLAVPYERTWSCYQGLETPCLKCGTCIEREGAFRQAGVEDPLSINCRLKPHFSKLGSVNRRIV